MEKISHKGKIIEITPEFTTVEIVAESACAACHAKGLCGVSESVSKAIQVPTRGWENHTVGEDVMVVLKASMGHKAVWLAYVLPLVVLMAVLLGLIALDASELAAGLSGIAAVGVYYFCIWLLRDKLKNEYVFSIESNY